MGFPLAHLSRTGPVIAALTTGGATTSAVVIVARRAGGLDTLAAVTRPPAL